MREDNLAFTFPFSAVCGTAHRRYVGRKNRPGREIWAVMCLSVYVLHSPRLGSRVCTSVHRLADIISFFCFHFAVFLYCLTHCRKQKSINSVTVWPHKPTRTCQWGGAVGAEEGHVRLGSICWKGVSVLCNLPGDAVWLQQCRCCPGFSWSIAAPGTKPSNGAKKCGHTIIQELLCLTKNSELVLESLKALLMWSFLLYIAWALLQF